MPEHDATPVMETLAAMTDASIERITLDPAVQILVRLAALVALDADPASYRFHFAPGAELGFTGADVQQVLITLAPLVGTARIVSATSKIARALGVDISVDDIDQ